MSKDVREHIKRCECFKERPSTEEIKQTEAEYPLEIIHVDFLVIGGTGADPGFGQGGAPASEADSC